MRCHLNPILTLFEYIYIYSGKWNKIWVCLNNIMVDPLRNTLIMMRIKLSSGRKLQCNTKLHWGKKLYIYSFIPLHSNKVCKICMIIIDVYFGESEIFCGVHLQMAFVLHQSFNVTFGHWNIWDNLHTPNVRWLAYYDWHILAWELD